VQHPADLRLLLPPRRQRAAGGFLRDMAQRQPGQRSQHGFDVVHAHA
jgi:hypothetical protein